MGRKYGKVFNKTCDCQHCKSSIDEDDSSIECWKCFSWYHVECTILDRRKFLDIINTKSSWFCNLCSNKNEIVVEEFLDSDPINFDSTISKDSSSFDDNDQNCLKCLVNLSDSSSYQQVFDQTGKKLNLQAILSECFDIDVKEVKNEFQALCNDCVNELIETYNLMQEELNNFKLITNKNEVKLEVLSSDDDDDENDEFDDDLNKNNDNEEESETAMEIDDSKTSEINEDGDGGDGFENVYYLDDYDESLDIRSYKEKVIKNHKFNEIRFPNPIECRLCLQKIEDHLKIIEHTKEVHFENNGENISYSCVIDDSCTTPLNSVEELSYHLIFKHYDLQDLIILAECPECKQFFESFIEYNEHCCDTIKRYNRSQTECEQCGKIFKSNKRYRFHLQFHLEKRRPKACLICDTMYRDEDEFYEHVKYGHGKNIENVCRSCDLVFSTKENLENHTANIHHNKYNSLVCAQCGKSFATKLHLKQHTKIHENSQYECHICGKKLSRKSRLNKHLVQHQNPIDKDVITCAECGYVGRDDEDAETHLLNKHEDCKVSVEIETLSIAYICEHCDSAFNSIENLLNHREKHQKNEYFCNICNCKLDKYSTLSSHKLSHAKHIEKQAKFPIMRHFVCEVSGCSKTYPLWTSLNLHKIKYHGPRRKDLICTKCDLIFPTFFEYKNHLTDYHEGKLIFDCLFCNKSCRLKSALTLHVKKAHKKPIEEVIKKEKKTAKIKTEQEISDLENPEGENAKNGKKLKKEKVKKEKTTPITNEPKQKNFNCNVCGRAFSTRFEVKYHYRSVHEKIARFFCPNCPFKTPYRQTLTYHMKTHSNDYPYECSICSRKFRFKSSHKLHEQRHQNVKNYVCNIDGCCLSYVNIARLKTHQKLKHSPNAKITKFRKRSTNLGLNKYSDTFIDDDDGLDDLINETTNQQLQQISSSSSSSSYQSQLNVFQNQTEFNTEGGENITIIQEDVTINPDDPAEYYIEGNELDEEEINEEIVYNNVNYIKPVIIIRNNDYIMELDHTKIYGNALEVTSIQETEVGATEIVGE